MKEEDFDNEYFLDDEEEEDTQIDWQGLFNKLWKGRKTIILTTIIFMVFGIIAAFSTRRTYTVGMLLVPEVNSPTSSRSGLGSIASMLGVGSMSMLSSSDAVNVIVYPEVISSTPFLVDLLETHVEDPRNGIDTTLIGYLSMPRGGFDPLAWLPKIDFSSLIGGDGDEKDDATEAVAGNSQDIDKFRLTRKQAAMVKYLNGCIKADVDNKTGMTTITVTLDNPRVAALVAKAVCDNLHDYVIDYRTQKAREDLEQYEILMSESYEKYIAASDAYARYKDSNHGIILNSVLTEGTRLQNEQNLAAQVYSQMAQQAEMARAKVQEAKPVFAIIEPATTPLKPSNSRKKPLLMWTFLGLAGSAAWVLFLKNAWGKLKATIRMAKENKAD